MCPHCGAEMKLIALIDDDEVIEKILRHLKLWWGQIAHEPRPFGYNSGQAPTES